MIMNKEEAIQIIKDKLPNLHHSFGEAIVTLIPELKENKEERIVNLLKMVVEKWHNVGYADYVMDIPKSDIRAWIEKQGRQKPAGETKLKIEEGKWYVCTKTYVLRGKIVVIKDQTYKSNEDGAIEGEGGHLFIDKIDGKVLDYFRPWCIDDAKDGDVLASSTGAFIYNGNNGGGSCPGSYCGINILGRFQIGIEHHWTGKPVSLATKDQRDILFAKMKEAGYEWDHEKKKLKKIEPKFKVGDWVVCKNGSHRVFQVIERSWPNAKYRDIKGNEIFLNVFTLDKQYRPWTIQDAKDGDVLATKDAVFIFKHIDKTGLGLCKSYCEVIGNSKLGLGFEFSINGVYPATKEQRDALMKSMSDAGYIFDFEKKELKKIEEEFNGEDYGIDSLFHAQRILEKTLGKVDGYQSDDGILEHKCAISTVKKLYEQKPWSEEDEIRMDNICHFLGDYGDQYYGHLTLQCTISWLRSFKNRVMSQNLTATDEEITQAKKEAYNDDLDKF